MTRACKEPLMEKGNPRRGNARSALDGLFKAEWVICEGVDGCSADFLFFGGAGKELVFHEADGGAVRVVIMAS